MGIGDPGEPSFSETGIDKGGRAPISLEEARRGEAEIFQRWAQQRGRLEVADQVRALLRGRVSTSKIPGSRPPTPEEKAIWDLVDGLAQRMGATIEEVEAGHR